MRRLLLLAVALIAYGSLYPWQLRDRPGRMLVHSSWGHVLSGFTIRDAVVNVALYVPLGLAGYLALPSTAAPPVRVLIVLCAGCLLSLSVETAQLFIRGRTSAALDVFSNTTGAGLGAVLGTLRHLLLRPAHHPRAIRDPAVVLLLFCWIGSLAFPFVPHLRSAEMFRKAGILANADSIQIVPVFTSAVFFFIGGHLLNALRLRRPSLWLFLCSLLIPLQVVIASRTPEISNLLGAMAGVLIFMVTGPRPRVAAALAVSALFVQGFYPFQAASAAQRFTWMPFGGLLGIEWQRATVILATKVFACGAAIWLLHRVGASLLTAAGAVVLITGAAEFCQIYLPGRTPEVADPLIAALVAFVFAQVREALAQETQRV